MKKQFFTIVFVLCSCLNVFSQATSLTIDCQNPGQLSNMINFSDQNTLMHLTVTGNLNGYDLQFLTNLNKNRSLKVVDLENTSLVGGTDDRYSRYYLRGGYFQKIVLPKSVKSIASYYSSDPINGDSLIWTSPNIKEIDVESDLGKFLYTDIPEGVEKIGGMSDRTKNSRITFPNSIDSIMGSSSTQNLIIYSYIDNPESVSAFWKSDLSSTKWSAINNSTFFIPKGTLEKYLKSDFSTLRNCVNGNSYGVNNGNKFIEYYDVDSVMVKSPIYMYIGDTLSLEVSIYPNDSLVSWVNYHYENPEIINIQSDGTIVAKGYGQTEVFATPHVFIDGLETKTGSCVVNVLAHVEGIDMPATMSLHIGEQKTINAKTLPLEITDNQLSYVSSNSSIATITDDGFVVGNKRGTCTITATSVDGGYTATCEVTVTQPVEAVTMEKHNITLKVGESERLFANISPATADDKTISWHSSNEQIASVDASGNVSAQKAGEAWIKVVSNDNVEAKDSCIVIVSQPVTGIQLDNKTYQLNGIGESFELKAIVVPDDASNKNVKWKSSDESVCVVSQGTVVAVGYGTCVIIATTEDGGFMATCTVTVNNITGISTVSPNNGKHFQIYDANGSKRTRFQKGVNIIHFVDGTKKKVIIR